ncbi:glycoside hydrolase family 88 protein [Streptomyces sp. NPDC002778]
MKLVNDYWIAGHADPGSNAWDRATYHSGNMYHFRATGDQRYLDYTKRWADRHSYGLAGGAGTRNADNQCAGQVYLDLYEELGGEGKLAALDSSLTAMTNSTQRTDWWWIDAWHMAMPPFARMGRLRGDYRYWVTMYELYHHTKRLIPDRQGRITGLGAEWTGLFYRDSDYVIDAAKASSPNGKPVLWSRGNGWAAAAHAKTLAAMPANDKRTPEYAHTLRSMAEALKPLQRTDGFWNVNLADPAHFAGPETSGTAFFTFALAYGINAGWLDRAVFLPVVTRAWNGLTGIAVREDGFLGYVQAVAAAPGPASATATADFGVGAFLMAGSEMARLAL